MQQLRKTGVVTLIHSEFSERGDDLGKRTWIGLAANLAQTKDPGG